MIEKYKGYWTLKPGRRKLKAPIFRLTKRNGIWYVTWTADGRSRRVSFGTASKKEAEKQLAGFTPGPRRPVSNKRGCVYIIGNDANALLKIGAAAGRHAKDRLATLQIGSPTRLFIVQEYYCLTFRMALAVEGRFKTKFWPRRSHGEWYAVPYEEIDGFAMSMIPPPPGAETSPPLAERQA